MSGKGGYSKGNGSCCWGRRKDAGKIEMTGVLSLAGWGGVLDVLVWPRVMSILVE